MAHHKADIKHAKSSRKANERNRAYRSMMRTAIKRVRSAPDKETADAEFRKASSVIDRMVGKNIIHRNNAANHKSRLAKWIYQHFSG